MMVATRIFCFWILIIAVSGTERSDLLNNGLKNAGTLGRSMLGPENTLSKMLSSTFQKRVLEDLIRLTADKEHIVDDNSEDERTHLERARQNTPEEMRARLESHLRGWLNKNNGSRGWGNGELPGKK